MAITAKHTKEKALPKRKSNLINNTWRIKQKTGVNCSEERSSKGNGLRGPKAKSKVNINTAAAKWKTLKDKQELNKDENMIYSCRLLRTSVHAHWTSNWCLNWVVWVRTNILYYRSNVKITANKTKYMTSGPSPSQLTNSICWWSLWHAVKSSSKD